MHPSEGGHLFADESELKRLTRMYPPGPPPWKLNEFGQPTWLLASDLHQLAGSWAVIIPPEPGVEVPVELGVARALDRQDQRLAPFGTDMLPAEVARCRSCGPAQMPVIPWSTPRLRRPGRPTLAFTDPDLAAIIAWLIDIRCWTNRRIANVFFPEDVKRVHEDFEVVNDHSNYEKKAHRYAKLGRLALCHRGVWPWLSFPLDELDRIEEQPIQEEIEGEGVLPDEWWQSMDVLAHLELWIVLAHDLLPRRKEAVARLLNSDVDELPSAWL